jgi:hypothetical protein
MALALASGSCIVSAMPLLHHVSDRFTSMVRQPAAGAVLQRSSCARWIRCKVTPRACADIVDGSSEMIIEQMQEKISLCDCVCPAWQRRLIDIY